MYEELLSVLLLLPRRGMPFSTDEHRPLGEKIIKFECFHYHILFLQIIMHVCPFVCSYYLSFQLQGIEIRLRRVKDLSVLPLMLPRKQRPCWHWTWKPLCVANGACFVNRSPQKNVEFKRVQQTTNMLPLQNAIARPKERCDSESPVMITSLMPSP